MKTQSKFAFISHRPVIYTAEDLMSSETLTALGGCADNGEKQGLGAFQVDIEVDVVNKETGDARSFMLAFQPEERTNGMRNYSGYEMVSAEVFGDEMDESQALLEFCGGDEWVLNMMLERATELAKEELEKLTDNEKGGAMKYQLADLNNGAFSDVFETLADAEKALAEVIAEGQAENDVHASEYESKGEPTPQASDFFSIVEVE